MPHKIAIVLFILSIIGYILASIKLDSMENRDNWEDRNDWKK
jgi:hypothetical protein